MENNSSFQIHIAYRDHTPIYHFEIQWNNDMVCTSEPGLYTPMKVKDMQRFYTPFLSQRHVLAYKRI